MPACANNTITVTQAGTTGFLGTYTSTAVDGNGFSVFIKDGDAAYRIVVAQNIGGYFWYMQKSTEVFPGVFDWTNYYNSQAFASSGAVPACPYDGTTWISSGAGALPVPVVAAPVPDPYAQWGGYANYARLRLLEYI
jgi:hypothetical protein